MTRAPSNLLAVRSLLLEHLDNAPGPNDLDPAEVGIVGDPAHRGGYHCGSDRVTTNDYSVVESSRDRAGLTDYAAGLDVGPFSVTVGGRTHNLRTFSLWCVGQCAAKAPDARDIREIIYSPDGESVRRFDALGRRATGDDSHLYHTHFSFFRDAIKAGRDQRPLFRRYLTSIGLLEDQDMTPDQAKQLQQTLEMTAWVKDFLYLALNGQDKASGGENIELAKWVREGQADRAVLKANLQALAGKDWTDESAIIQGVLAGLSPEAIAAAIPPTMAAQVAENLAQRLVA